MELYLLFVVFTFFSKSKVFFFKLYYVFYYAYNLFSARYGFIIGNNVNENYIKFLTCIFKNFASDLNNVFQEIKNLNSFEFELIVKNDGKNFQFEFDEEDVNLIIVRIRLKNVSEFEFLTIILYLDVNDIFAYPNRILTEPLLPEFLQKINPSKWSLEKRLYDNLLILFDDFIFK